MRNNETKNITNIILRDLFLQLALFVFIPLISHSQNIDSLTTKWQKIKGDTSVHKKLDLLFEIGKTLNFSNPDSSVFYYEKAIKLARKNHLTNKVAKAISGMGGIHYIKGEYDFAMDDFMKAMEMWEKNNNQRGIGIGLNNMGLIQNMQEHYRQAIRNFKKALQISRAINDSASQSRYLFNLAISYYSMNKYDSALMFAEKGWTIKKQMGKYKEGLRIINLIGNIYAAQGSFVKATNAYLKVIKTEGYSNKWEISYAMAGLADLYKKTGRLDKSIEYGLKSYQLAKEVNAKWDKQNVTKIIADAYAEKGDYRNAYNYHLLHKKFSDSVFNKRRENKITYLRLKRKQSENKALEKENKLQEVMIKKRNNQLIAFITGIVALIVVIFLLYRNNYIKSKLNKNLQQKNAEIANKNKELKEVNHTKDTLFRVIAHDLKNPISVVVSYTEVISEDFDDYDREELLEIIQKLNKSSNEGLRLLENLMEWARTQSGAISFEPQQINIHNIVNENINLLQSNAKEKEIELSANVNPALEANADYNLTSTVIRNLISNALKFTPDQGKIVVEAEEQDSHYKISVKDNGTGIKQEDIPKLFDLTQAYKQKGTRNERGTGLGLMICKEFVEKQGGDIWVESQEGKGSTFSFTLPMR